MAKHFGVVLTNNSEDFHYGLVLASSNRPADSATFATSSDLFMELSWSRIDVFEFRIIKSFATVPEILFERISCLNENQVPQNVR